MIRLLERNEIDDKKWNGCVHFGFNGMPYGYSWYLDIVGEHWKGLVYKDYQAVLPLVWNKKWGIEYLYQPMFNQQLGLFSLDPLRDSLVDEFYKAIPEEYKLVEIQVNAGNWKENSSFEVKERPNFLLNLDRSYEDITEQYSKNVKRSLKQSEKQQLKISNQIKAEDFAEFYRKHTAPKVQAFKKKHFFMLMRLVYNALHYNSGFTSVVRDSSGNLEAAGFFIFNQKFVINLAPATSESGRKSGAMHMLIDYVIRLNCDKPRFLDFEGSSIESIANFYKGFGAEKQIFYQIKRNNLPWYIKLLKK